MKKIITPLVLILIVGAIAYTLFNNKQEMNVQAVEAMKTSKAIPVRAEVVGKSVHAISFTANGTFEANQELKLQSEGAGKITKIYKRKGDNVKTGDLIAQIDDDLLQSELVINTLSFEQAKKDLERYKNLAATDAITKKQMEDIQNGYKTAEAQLKMIRKRIANTRITAPIGGYINDDHIEIGTLVSPGMPIVDIVNTNPLKLSIHVSESEIAEIAVGDKVEVKAGVYPDKVFQGKVSFIASKGDASMRYKVEISIADATNGLKPGMFAYASFNYEKQEAILISRRSLASSLKNPEVYVVENGHAKLKSIKVAPIGQDHLLLLDGLKEGEKLIVSGLINLKDGTPVTVL